MADTVSLEFKEQFMQDKYYHDSLSQAIKIAKANGIDDKVSKPLVMAKQDMKAKCHKNSENLLRRMALGDNLSHLQDSWYAIRYSNDKGDIVLKQECIKPDDVYLLKRDGRHERELNRVELDNFLPAIQSEEALEVYKQSIRTTGYNLVYEFTGVLIDSDEAQSKDDEVIVNKTMVSSHAGMRWVQRIMSYASKDDKKAEEYRRANLAMVNTAVLDSFSSAGKVWTSDRDGITYWFNSEDIVMFVVGSNNIITLYEEEFGFSKDMNRMIVKEQLKVLAQAHEELRQAEDAHEKSISTIEANIKGINDELAVMEAQMALLVAKRATMSAEREQTSKEVRLSRTKYDVEFDKLFKKWDV